MTKGDIVYIRWKGANTKAYFLREIDDRIVVELENCRKGEIIVPLSEVHLNDNKSV